MRPSYHQYLLDSLVTGIIHVDADLRIMLVNAAAADLLHTSPNAARGRRLAECLPADEEFLPLLERAISTGEPLATAEQQLVTGPPPGDVHPVSLSITPFSEEGSGAVIELIGLDRRKTIAAEDRLASQQQSRRALVRGLAHEIKNPLGGLRGAAQLLAMDIDDPEHLETLGIMIRETDRLRDLVENLLGPNRRMQKRRCNIHEITEHVIRLMANDEDNLVEFRRDYDPSIPEFSADPDQLTQVVMNLVTNAVKAVAGVESATITCTTRIDRQYTLNGQLHKMICRVAIMDNGIGVPPELRDSIFYPLVSGSDGGTGMGLAIAQDIIHRHGGIIELNSEPGRTAFHVLLPLDTEEAK